MSKGTFAKFGIATALALTSLNSTSTFKKNAEATTLKNAVKRVQISNPYGANLWSNYKSGHLKAYHAKQGSKWNVAKTALDSANKLWYKVGNHEWIQAENTTELLTKVKSSKKNKAVSQAPSKASAVVALAKSELGKPYIMGATGPNAFDCSGLVQFVFKNAVGINLPRTTQTQVTVGKTVPMNKLKAGDLLFWGKTISPYHVAIYIGNNKYINSATPAQGTIVQTISSGYYPSVAKRVL